MNFTAVPHPSGQPLGFLTYGRRVVIALGLDIEQSDRRRLSPMQLSCRQDRAAGCLFFASNDTDLVVDINGYFAPPGEGGLAFYPATPCRVVDTRQTGDGQPFFGQQTIDVANSACTPSNVAQAYVFSTTVVPPASLGFITLCGRTARTGR